MDMFLFNQAVKPTHELLAYRTPNIKKLIKPDTGKIICDVDLEQADARVVAWTSGAKNLKRVFNDPTLDLHTENAKLIYGSCDGKKDPRRQKAKAGCHAANYNASARTLAIALGCTQKEAEDFKHKWFTANPELSDWHSRVRHSLQTTRSISNAFGYRRMFLDRISETTFNEALAWEPQSTVGLVINKVWDNIVNTCDFIDVLLQVHDSLVLQFPVSKLEEALIVIKDAFNVPLHYKDDTLIIACGKPELSLNSWGECKSYPWDITKDSFLKDAR